MTKLGTMIALRIANALHGFTSEVVEGEEGQTLAEYALILALIAVVVVGAVILLGGNINNIFNNVSSKL